MVTRPIADLAELSPHFVSDPYPVYARLRAEGPVHHVRAPDGEELWLVVGYEACRTAFTDPRLSRDWMKSGDITQIVNTDQDQPALAHMLMSDPRTTPACGGWWHGSSHRAASRRSPRASSRSPTNCWTP